MTWICHGCGEELGETHPAERVACPDCKAPAGARCRKPSGHRFWANALPHVAREQLAVDTGAMSRCPKAKPLEPPAQLVMF